MTPAVLFVISVNFILGLAAGSVMFRSDFCVAGMFRDIFLFRNPRMLRFLLLLVVASMFLFELMRQIGVLPLYPFPLLGSPSIANIIGGAVFGIGMVLAGGCVVGTLYKMGGGSIISGIAFIGLIAGSALYAEIHPWWIVIVKKYSFLQGKITLAQAVGLDPVYTLTPLILLSGLLFYRWYKLKIFEQTSFAEGYLQPWKAALYLAALGALSYLFVGMPFGITTAYAKIAAYMTGIVAPEHVSRIAFYNGVPLNYTTPFGQATLQGGAGPFIDAISYIQFPLIAGIILGAMVTAMMIGEFKIYYRVPLRQYISAFAGGSILALGSRMTPGCNVWHIFGGLPILNVQSILFLAGILPGAYVGSKILANVVLSSSASGS